VELFSLPSFMVLHQIPQRRGILCITIHNAESTSVFSFMVQSESLCSHSWCGVNLCVLIYGTECISVFSFMMRSESLCSHSWCEVNLCVRIHRDKWRLVIFILISYIPSSMQIKFFHYFQRFLSTYMYIIIYYISVLVCVRVHVHVCPGSCPCPCPCSCQYPKSRTT
jgi:hypothetical protein